MKHGDNCRWASLADAAVVIPRKSETPGLAGQFRDSSSSIHSAVDTRACSGPNSSLTALAKAASSRSARRIGFASQSAITSSCRLVRFDSRSRIWSSILHHGEIVPKIHQLQCFRGVACFTAAYLTTRYRYPRTRNTLETTEKSLTFSAGVIRLL